MVPSTSPSVILPFKSSFSLYFFLHPLSVSASLFFHPFSYLYHPPTPFTLSFTLFTPLSAHSLILSSLIPPLPSHSSHPQTHPPFSLTLSQSPPSSLHTVTSFLLPVRTPWFEATPLPLLPPPPGMKCSCSMVFCLFAAKASLLAL